jgi:G3E family GTPase
MKTKIDIFSGFLGAGKTMLIKKLINEKLASENIVIIENEFGQVGIDGSILKRSNINVREITSGCICCSIAGDFRAAITDIINQYKPSRIIIEPTGVAKLSEILSVFKDPLIKDITVINLVLAVVDVLKYELYIANFNEFYADQIKNAKTVVLSRTQNADSKKLMRVTEAIRQLNNKASIVTTPWDNLTGEKIIEAGEADVLAALNKKVSLLKRPSASAAVKSVGSVSRGHSADQVFQSWGYETPKQFNPEVLKTMLGKLADEKAYGTVLRAKGILQTPGNRWIQFDYVPGEYEYRETTADYTGRLCVIGSGLMKENIKKLFNE